MIEGLLFCNFYQTKFIFIELNKFFFKFYAFGTKFIKQIDFKAIFPGSCCRDNAHSLHYLHMRIIYQLLGLFMNRKFYAIINYAYLTTISIHTCKPNRKPDFLGATCNVMNAMLSLSSLFDLLPEEDCLSV